MAAAVGVRKVVEDPFGTIMNNVVETAGLLDFWQKRQPQPSWRAPVKSMAWVRDAPSERPMIRCTGQPLSHVGHTLTARPLMSIWRSRLSRSCPRWLSVFNTVGPRQRGDWGMVLPRFVKAALANAPIEVHGDGQQKRCLPTSETSLTPFEVAAFIRCRGLPVNLGHDEPITILALTELVRQVLNSDSSIQILPYKEVWGRGFRISKNGSDLGRANLVSLPFPTTCRDHPGPR